MGWFSDVLLPIAGGAAFAGIPLLFVNFVFLSWAKGVHDGATEPRHFDDYGERFVPSPEPRHPFKRSVYRRGLRKGRKRRNMENTKIRVKRKELY